MASKTADRLFRMGGPAAWKEMQKNKDGWNDGGFGEARRIKDGGDDDGGDGREARCYEYDVDSERLRDEEPSDEDGFTMGMMLRSLNIELDTIGYDKHAQRWAD
ncbi:hypothetical protein FGG08_002989 [Glutinoglossum americanum]|uniref:Uncharacterized protein n=1 Tax=Glutinoglossum americanum TaxID=1670608 RepID=A0A9P8I8M8_9PEZI|nr:hypothetical protein FGG08_002989 [Glutinoglossum americanum]